MHGEHETLSEKRLIAVGANSASGAARLVIVVAIRNLALARKLNLADRVEQPPAPLLGEFYPPYLLAGVDHECIESGNL